LSPVSLLRSTKMRGVNLSPERRICLSPVSVFIASISSIFIYAVYGPLGSRTPSIQHTHTPPTHPHTPPPTAQWRSGARHWVMSFNQAALWSARVLKKNRGSGKKCTALKKGIFFIGKARRVKGTNVEIIDFLKPFTVRLAPKCSPTELYL
jgi:hypothetical protein